MSNNNTNTNQREFEEGATGTQKTRKNDPLIEYSEKEPMTPAKIKEHEPTAVKRDPTDQKIVSGGRTGTDSPEALEEYRRQGMTKVSEDNASTISTSTISEQQRQNQGKGEPEQYKEEGYTEEKISEVANTVKDSAESTFDKIKAGAKALGEKVINPNNNLEEEYNKEKSQSK